jgi:hypothetical protein
VLKIHLGDRWLLGLLASSSFGSLMFSIGEDRNLELLTRGPASKHHALVYGQPSYLPIDPSTSSRACSGLNSYAGPYYLSAVTPLGRPIGKTILQPPAGESSSSSSGATPNQESLIDYLEFGGSVCWNPAIKDYRINMLEPCHQRLSHQHGGPSWGQFSEQL